MNSKRSRLARKAARIEKTQFEKALDSELGQARREREKALHEASKTYKDSVAELRLAHAKAAGEAWKRYDAARDSIVQKLAADEAKAA